MEINKSSIGQTNCDLPTKNNPIINSLSLQRVFRSDTRYYLVQFTNFSRQRMLLTFDVMTGRADYRNNVPVAVAESRSLGGRKLWRTLL